MSVALPALSRLQMLATHPKLLPVLLELGGGAPHLAAHTLIYHAPRAGPPHVFEAYGQLHCHREFGGDSSYAVQPPGRVTSEDFNVFPYFEPVRPGDGGLAVVPASHKSVFSRPRSLCWPYGQSGETTGGDASPCPDITREETDAQALRLITTAADGQSKLRVPDGLVQLTPEAGAHSLIANIVLVSRSFLPAPCLLLSCCSWAGTTCIVVVVPPITLACVLTIGLGLLSTRLAAAGDFIIVSESTSHCIMPWQPTDRCRAALTMRYYSGRAHEARLARSPGGYADAELKELRARFAPATRAMIDGVGVRAWDGGDGVAAAARL